MHPLSCSARKTSGKTAGLVASAVILAGLGCASPGPPRSPSLRLPQPVRDLTASRIGNTVELHFTAPSQSTDKLPLRGSVLTGQICRQVQDHTCTPVASSKTDVALAGPNGTRNSVTWTDTLPSSLAHGSPRLLAYRVEFFSAAGHSAGPSAPAFTAAGSAPAPVNDLHAEGSRLGIVLAWSPSDESGQILLKREDLAPQQPDRRKPAAHPRARHTYNPKASTRVAPAIVWLETNKGMTNPDQPSQTLDTTARPDTPYSYSAQQQLTVRLGDHIVEMRSPLSRPIPFTLHEIYPPPAPTGLTAVGFFAGAAPSSAAAPRDFAVDLIWQPVDDSGLIAGLAGYNVYRQTLEGSGESAGGSVLLNTAPVPVPSFHDATASPAAHYRYSVTSVDEKGNESRPSTVLLESSAAQ